MNVSVVLFDLDGTLLDTIDLLLASVRWAFRERSGRVPTREEWVAGIGTPLASQMRVYATDEQDLATLIDGYREYQRAHHDELTRAYADAIETVVDLRRAGYRTGVVTSKASDIANRSLAFVGLDHYLDVVVGFDSTDRHKPDPEPVRYALDVLQAPPSEAVFVGDSPHDMYAGNAAGVITVGALWGPFPRSALLPASPRFYLDRIRDLPPLLERLKTL
ncbi:MAG TPA: HAD-IA family hydrolase [Gemmatimonadaceae bacterium]|jgi:pyrophosphatase PpaX|nr:HAD-IA family hydrolase [Gemmatimonadaceae bacterium]